MKKSQNPSAVRSRQEISTALLKLMQEYPYAEISVKQIIMETSLARKTFYLNFRSKDDVLASILNELIGEYTEALSKENVDPLTVIFSFCDGSLFNQSSKLYGIYPSPFSKELIAKVCIFDSC